MSYATCYFVYCCVSNRHKNSLYLSFFITCSINQGPMLNMKEAEKMKRHSMTDDFLALSYRSPSITISWRVASTGEIEGAC